MPSEKTDSMDDFTTTVLFIHLAIVWYFLVLYCLCGLAVTAVIVEAEGKDSLLMNTQFF